MLCHYMYIPQKKNMGDIICMKTKSVKQKLPDPELFIISNDVPTKIHAVGQTLVDIMP